MLKLATLLALDIALLTACDASIETADGIKTSDPLYAEVKMLCEPDALILRVVDLENDEAMCCLDYDNGLSAHCATASGAVVSNPSGLSKLKNISQQTKIAHEKLRN